METPQKQKQTRLKVVKESSITLSAPTNHVRHDQTAIAEATLIPIRHNFGAIPPAADITEKKASNPQPAQANAFEKFIT